VIPNLAVALGIGLLVGAERERRKGDGPSRSPAGIRTFTVASLAGAVSVIAGGQMLLATTTAGVVILTTAAYCSGSRLRASHPASSRAPRRSARWARGLRRRRLFSRPR